MKACWLKLLSTLKIPLSWSSLFCAGYQNCFRCDETGIPGFFLVDWRFLSDASSPSSLTVDRNQYCSFSFPHMPPCLPEYSSLRSTGSASMRRYPRTWSTGSAAARASASHKAGSGEVGAKITRIATAAPNEPARFPEMESQVRRTEVHGSLSRGYLCIPPSAPIRGEHTSNCVFNYNWLILMSNINRWIETQLEKCRRCTLMIYFVTNLRALGSSQKLFWVDPSPVRPLSCADSACPAPPPHSMLGTWLSDRYQSATNSSLSCLKQDLTNNIWSPLPILVPKSSAFILKTISRRNHIDAHAVCTAPKVPICI